MEISKPAWIISELDASGHHVVIGEPLPEHVEELSFSMRNADRLEIRKATSMRPREALRWSIDQSAWVRVGLIDGQVTAIWGLVLWGSVTSCKGSPWAITSRMVNSFPKTFYRLSRFYVDQMRAMCPKHMEVNVDAQYPEACRWLRRLGFKLTGIKVNGYPFYSAQMGEEIDRCASR